MSEIDYQHTVLRTDIENLKTAIGLSSDERQKTALYTRLGERFAEYIRLTEQHFQGPIQEIELERELGA